MSRLAVAIVGFVLMVVLFGGGHSVLAQGPTTSGSITFTQDDGMNLLAFPVCTKVNRHSGCPPSQAPMYGRIGWFTEWPEMQWCVNRKIGPTGSEPAALDTAEFNAQCIGLLGLEDEVQVVNTSTPTMVGPHASSAVRVHRYGVSFGADYWVERNGEAPDQNSPGFVWGVSDGVVARLDRSGLHMLRPQATIVLEGQEAAITLEGRDSSVRASYFVARSNENAYNMYAIVDQNGGLQWAFRLNADNSLSLVDATGDVVQVWNQR